MTSYLLDITLVSRNSDSSHNSRAGHPSSTPTRLPRRGPRGWLRCSSLTYSRYARSSRLAIRAPRSGTYATNHCYGTLGGCDGEENMHRGGDGRHIRRLPAGPDHELAADDRRAARDGGGRTSP